MPKPDTTLSSTGSSRIIMLDQLRGLCLMFIIIDHLVLFPSLFELFTGRGFLWLSAAEGFFFISGMLVGMIRGRQALRAGLRAASRTLLRRAGKLYIATVVLTLIYTTLGLWLGHAGIIGSKVGLIAHTSLPDLLWRTLTLAYSYGWSDFLVYYIVYLLLSPLALWLLLRGRWRWVLGLALLGWIEPWVANLPFPNGLRWQVYFFIGLVVGFYADTLRAWWASRPALRKHQAQTAAIATAVGGMAVSFIITIPPIWWPTAHNWFLDATRSIEATDLYRALFETGRSGLARLPFFLIAFGAALVVLQRYQAWIMRRLNWLLEPLGANSLYVYIMQGAFAFGLPFLAIPNHLVTNTLLPVVVILCIWLLVRQRFLFKIIPR